MIDKRFISTAYMDAMRNLLLMVKNPDLQMSLINLAESVARAFSTGKKLLIAGNGGSHCSALHIAEEFTGRFRKDRLPLPALALGEATHTSCVSNDYGFDLVFARQVAAFAQQGDVLLLLSTSGNSKNLLVATEIAKTAQMQTAAFLGRDGGILKDQIGTAILFPGETSDRIQELQMLAGHILVELVERMMFPENYLD